MKFEDSGLIIDVKKHNENSAIVKIFSQNHGIYRGFVKSAFSKKNQSIFQVGNLVSFEWRSRIEENLGSFYYCDLSKSYSSKIIFDKLRLSCFLSIVAIINNNFHEREVLKELYAKLINTLESFSNQNSDRKIIIDYIFFEFDILAELGYGMDLTSCAVSNSDEDLIYVSPKSGRAVSRNIGQPYSQKILDLPGFVHAYANNLIDQMSYDNDNVNITDQDILNGIKLTGYFLEKHIFAQDNQCQKHRSTTTQNILRTIGTASAVCSNLNE